MPLLQQSSISKTAHTSFSNDAYAVQNEDIGLLCIKNNETFQQQ